MSATRRQANVSAKKVMVESAAISAYRNTTAIRIVNLAIAALSVQHRPLAILPESVPACRISPGKPASSAVRVITNILSVYVSFTYC